MAVTGLYGISLSQAKRLPVTGVIGAPAAGAVSNGRETPCLHCPDAWMRRLVEATPHR